MITKAELGQGVKLRIKNEQAALGADRELEVLFAGDQNVLVKTEDGNELTSDYTALSAMYEVVPLVEPTKDNFIPRCLEQVELMIAHLSAFTQTQAAGGVNDNIVAIGTRLHALKGELDGYVAADTPEPANKTELLLKSHSPAA